MINFNNFFGIAGLIVAVAAMSIKPAEVQVETLPTWKRMDEIRAKRRNELTPEELSFVNYLDGVEADARWKAQYGGIDPAEILKAATAPDADY